MASVDTITLPWIEDDALTVEFDYYRASRGSRDKWGAPLEPDEPASIEIGEVLCNGYDISDYLDSKDYDHIEGQIWDWMEADAQDRAADEADYYYEQRRERLWDL